MTDIVYRGYHEAMLAGALSGGAPDIRLGLVMSAFSGQSEEDSVYVTDLTNLDEFDGLGYQRIDCQNVSFAYSDADDEVRLTFDSDEFNAVGQVVTPGSDDAIGLIVILNVNDDDAQSYLLGFTDQGGFPLNGSNTAIAYTADAAGLMFQRQAV